MKLSFDAIVTERDVQRRYTQVVPITGNDQEVGRMLNGAGEITPEKVARLKEILEGQNPPLPQSQDVLDAYTQSCVNPQGAAAAANAQHPQQQQQAPQPQQQQQPPQPPQPQAQQQPPHQAPPPQQQAPPTDQLLQALTALLQGNVPAPSQVPAGQVEVQARGRRFRIMDLESQRAKGALYKEGDCLTLDLLQTSTSQTTTVRFRVVKKVIGGKSLRLAAEGSGSAQTLDLPMSVADEQEFYLLAIGSPPSVLHDIFRAAARDEFNTVNVFDTDAVIENALDEHLHERLSNQFRTEFGVELGIGVGGRKSIVTPALPIHQKAGDRERDMLVANVRSVVLNVSGKTSADDVEADLRDILSRTLCRLAEIRLLERIEPKSKAGAVLAHYRELRQEKSTSDAYRDTLGKFDAK